MGESFSERIIEEWRVNYRAIDRMLDLIYDPEKPKVDCWVFSSLASNRKHFESLSRFMGDK